MSLCHIAPGVFLNKLAPVRPQASSQNGEQPSSQKRQKTFVSSNENVASTGIGCKPNLSKDVKLHFSRFFS